MLLVEDDEDDFDLTRDLLNEIDTDKFLVEWAPTYDAGLEALCRDGHDVCLLDFRLGGRDGLELLREARGQGCHSPIILLTGQGDREIDLQAMTAGAADYLIKGQLNAAQLDRSIRYAIAQKRHELEQLQLVLEKERVLRQSRLTQLRINFSRWFRTSCGLRSMRFSDGCVSCAVAGLITHQRGKVW